MRTYHYYELLQEEDGDIQHAQLDDYDNKGEDSKVHLRHRSGLWEAREEVTQYKTEVEDER